MKKVILIYGLIAGSIVAAMMFITMPMYNNGSLNVDNGELVGYTTMIVALSLIFFGIKSYRDNYQKGVISFWKAAQVGILIALIAALMYGIAWEVTYAQIGEEFTKGMTEKHFQKLKAEGATEAQMVKAKEEWKSFEVYYKNPAIRFAITLMEILPVGIIITLISAGLLKRKEFLQNREQRVTQL
ncbi:hypothetical protein BH09BAC3_BH09BAC3_37890 [soil metagenome]